MNRWQIFGLVLMVSAVAEITFFGCLNSAPWWEPVIILEIVTYVLFRATGIEN